MHVGLVCKVLKNWYKFMFREKCTESMMVLHAVLGTAPTHQNLKEKIVSVVFFNFSFYAEKGM